MAVDLYDHVVRILFPVANGSENLSEIPVVHLVEDLAGLAAHLVPLPGRAIQNFLRLVCWRCRNPTGHLFAMGVNVVAPLAEEGHLVRGHAIDRRHMERIISRLSSLCAALI